MNALTPDDLRRLTAPTDFLDYESDPVQGFVDEVVTDRGADKRRLAVELYYAVRDDVFYEVYGADLSRQGLRASSIASSRQGFCLHKSVLYAAACRAVGIPARIQYGDVRNHLASDRLRTHIGGDVFFHGLNSVHLDGKWVKATPVFNKILCRLYGMKPLEFDGTADSMHHAFDEQGHRSMEFLVDHGGFDDVPYEFVMTNMRRKHPGFLNDTGTGTVRGGSLAAEATG
ncbi:transglutaminase-like superfamily protein [Streptomyces sp. SID486]|uniref:transglutaminase-like domain-containing protein n=1 Tax=unclassified Streptomyces TaxID=2593676 RepID=UPI00136D2329|nr:MULTISPECIES: transglutaminase-like domain-containing protein [unclassified Streptomyces]MYW20964.1 transglutaminase-like superfamily protein [Streptomyces sp. SID2955]MYW47888.1 transglutaminase-like superfamily protein [Streptomyces sp. SID161]MYX96841.1 transglutaminase-like superfamily protein [Streptomyces sp. SID486]